VAEGAASIITNDIAARQPLSDEPATGVKQTCRVPVRQPADPSQHRSPVLRIMKNNRVELKQHAAVAAQHPCSAGSPPPLTEEDRRYRDQREEIVNTGIRAGIALARAIHDIHSYRGGVLWRAEFRSFADYCRSRWAYGKAHGYRLLDAGGFLASLDASQSPIGDSLPVSESQIRPLLSLVPEEHRIECWREITAGRETANLTATDTRSGARRYLRDRGLDPAPKLMTKRPMDELMARRVAMGLLEKLRAVVAGFSRQGEFERAIGGLAVLIEGADESPAIEVKATATVSTRPGADIGNPAAEGAAPDRGTSPGVGPAARAPKAARPAQAALENGPGRPPGSHSSPQGRHEDPETSSGPEHGCNPTGRIADGTDGRGFMNARLFHAFLRPGPGYGDWLAETADRHPADIRIPQDAGEESISLQRAWSIAHNDRGRYSALAFKIVTDVRNGGDADPGAVANALFEKELAASTASEGIDGNGGITPGEQTIRPISDTAD